MTHYIFTVQCIVERQQREENTCGAEMSQWLGSKLLFFNKYTVEKRFDFHYYIGQKKKKNENKLVSGSTRGLVLVLLQPLCQLGFPQCLQALGFRRDN